MKALIFLNIFLVNLVNLNAWQKCDEKNEIRCKRNQNCYKSLDNKFECRPRCPNGWECGDLSFKNKSDSKCGAECPNGLSCFQITESIYRCAVKCLNVWKCSPNPLTTGRIAFVPLVTPEEFINAVKAGGYQEPTPEQYHYLVSQAQMAGGITTKRELAMFLAQILWESDGLKAKREYACLGPNGCKDSYKSSGDYPDRQYYGRGYIQLTWSGNYKSASYDLFGDDRLLKDPDMVARDEKISWATAFWYWKTEVGVRRGIDSGEFGIATDAINGKLECNNGPNVHKAKLRFNLYAKVLKAFKIDETPIETGCYPVQ